jgi:hypothetical protein
MGNEVYANGREVSCKSAGGKSTASFPDVCFTPPQTPATPPGVPIPYPNTGMASDCSEGSKTVQISGQEVMLKDKSYFKKSTGDEAGSTPKKGVVSSKITGKVYFTMWSMDVKFEGENVVRHLDMTTHNHGNTPNTGPWPYTDAAARGKGGDCDQEVANEKAACKDYDPHKKGGGDVCEKVPELMKGPKELTRDEHMALAQSIQRGGGGKSRKKMSEEEKALECVKARRCELGPKEPSKCCPAQTPDHVLPAASFNLPEWEPDSKGKGGYDYNGAPCMCAEGPNNTWGSHGVRHHDHKSYPPTLGGKEVVPQQKIPFDLGASHAAQSSADVFSASGCRQKCIENQVKTGHQRMKSGPLPKVKYVPCGPAVNQAAVDASTLALNGGGP